MLSTRHGRFVNVIARIDRVAQTGTILYVNPVGVTLPPSPPLAGGAASRFYGFALSLQDVAGRELARLPAAVQVSGCGTEVPATALIQQDVPAEPGLAQFVLLLGERELDRFTAGPAAADLDQGMAPLRPAAIVPGAATKPHRLPLHVEPLPQRALGVSYTAQVRVEGTSDWNTIAVGADLPRIDLDRNQFADADTVAVRILRTNGLTDSILVEQDIALSDVER
jgi:hypothetical protein